MIGKLLGILGGGAILAQTLRGARYLSKDPYTYTIHEPLDARRKLETNLAKDKKFMAGQEFYDEATNTVYHNPDIHNAFRNMVERLDPNHINRLYESGRFRHHHVWGMPDEKSKQIIGALRTMRQKDPIYQAYVPDNPLDFIKDNPTLPANYIPKALEKLPVPYRRVVSRSINHSQLPEPSASLHSQKRAIRPSRVPQGSKRRDSLKAERNPS